jgi:hypothetical protein
MFDLCRDFSISSVNKKLKAKKNKKKNKRMSSNLTKENENKYLDKDNLLFPENYGKIKEI